MSNDLPQMDFDHAFHSDVIMMLVYSKKLLLTYGCFIRFENINSLICDRTRTPRRSISHLHLVK